MNLNIPLSESSDRFFSIIIPTRNRQNTLVSAVISILNQTFLNYELIVSDNSDNPVETIKALASISDWQANPKCRYIRPSRYMVMPDHWEFATSHATGEYVAILTDRFVMRPSALEVLATRIKANPTGDPDIVVWPVQSGFSEQTGIEYTAEFTGESSLLASRDILFDFAKFSTWRDGNFYFSKLPRGMNSLYKRSLALNIVEKNGRMFPPLSPDYSSAFLFLTYASEILYIDLPLYLSHGNKSTGQNSLIYGIHMLDADVDPFKDCPIPLDTVFNSVVRDFIFIKGMVSPELQEINIDMAGYFLSNYRELIVKESLGSPMDLQSLYQIWYQAVEKLPSSQQIEIKKNMTIINKMRLTPINIFKQKILRKLGLNNLRDYLRAVQSKFNHKHSGGMVYGNVIEAANATDYFIRKKCSIMENGKL